MKSLLIKHTLSTHLLSFLLAINILLVGSFYHVYCDVVTYYDFNELTKLWTYNQSGGGKSYYWVINNDSDIRFTAFKYNTTTFIYAICLTSGHSYQYANNSTGTNLTTRNVNNLSPASSSNNMPAFYTWQLVASSSTNYVFDIDIPVLDTLYKDSYTYTAYYYTFGEGAIEPLPPTPLYGDLIDVGFKTDIAGGNGGAYKQNLDTISWNTQIDSNNNPIPLGSLVDIVAVWGYWNDTTMTNMLNKDYLDFIIEDTFTVGTTRAENGSISFTWQDVYNKIDSPLGPWQEFLLSIFRYEDELYKYGWYYKIRWRNLDYTSEWKTIYTSTSDVSDSETIVNSTYISNEVINVVTNVNTQNNTTTEWTYDDITIDVDLTGIERLLKQIRDLVNSIYQWLKQFNINTGGDSEQEYPEIDNNGLNETIDELIQYEDEFNSNLNDNLEQLPSSSLNDFGEKFIASSNWVRDQYNRLTLNTPFYNLIVFSLFVGLALLLIGKYI